MRARTVWPEQWTDSEFVSCTFPARLLALALRNEADDRGVFRWNPPQLKMRLLPNDNIDIDALLVELLNTRQVLRFESEGVAFGIIRNFLRFQSPDRPTFKYPVPNDLPPDYGEKAALLNPYRKAKLGDKSESTRRSVGDNSRRIGLDCIGSDGNGPPPLTPQGGSGGGGNSGPFKTKKGWTHAKR